MHTVLTGARLLRAWRRPPPLGARAGGCADARPMIARRSGAGRRASRAPALRSRRRRDAREPASSRSGSSLNAPDDCSSTTTPAAAARALGGRDPRPDPAARRSRMGGGAVMRAFEASSPPRAAEPHPQPSPYSTRETPARRGRAAFAGRRPGLRSLAETTRDPAGGASRSRSCASPWGAISESAWSAGTRPGGPCRSWETLFWPGSVGRSAPCRRAARQGAARAGQARASRPSVEHSGRRWAPVAGEEGGSVDLPAPLGPTITPRSRRRGRRGRSGGARVRRRRSRATPRALERAGRHGNLPSLAQGAAHRTNGAPDRGPRDDANGPLPRGARYVRAKRRGPYEGAAPQTAHRPEGDACGGRTRRRERQETGHDDADEADHACRGDARAHRRGDPRPR